MEPNRPQKQNRPPMNKMHTDKDIVRWRGTWGRPATRGRTAKPPAFNKGEGGDGTHACLCPLALAEPAPGAQVDFSDLCPSPASVVETALAFLLGESAIQDPPAVIPFQVLAA